MALLNDVGPFAQYWSTAVAAWNDPELAKGGGPRVQYIWNSISQDYLARGETMPPGSFGYVNALISASAAVARAQNALAADWSAVQRSGFDRAINASHIARDIDSRELNQQPAGPNFRVRFRADVQAGGVGMTQWFTWQPGANLPATVGQLMNSLDIVGRGFAEDYQIEDVSLTGDAVITSY